MKYSALVERIAGEGADAWVVHYAARDAQERGEDVIVLSVGDPELDTPAAVLDKAIASLRAHDVRYTPAAGRHSLRTAIAAAHTARTAQRVDASQAIFLSGAQNALFTASLCVAGAGDEVLAIEPLYPSYPATIRASGANLVRVAAPACNGFRVDLAALRAAITERTRAVFFATPNNPSGVVMNEEELAVIAGLARRHDLWIVADEVYAALAPQGRVPGLAARLPEQVITVSSLSKSHSMPGYAQAGWWDRPNWFGMRNLSQCACCLACLASFRRRALPRLPCPTRPSGASVIYVAAGVS